MEQPLHGHGSLLITGVFQDMSGQSGHLGSLSLKRLNQMIFWGLFQPGLLCDCSFYQHRHKQPVLTPSSWRQYSSRGDPSLKDTCEVVQGPCRLPWTLRFIFQQNIPAQQTEDTKSSLCTVRRLEGSCRWVFHPRCKFIVAEWLSDQHLQLVLLTFNLKIHFYRPPSFHKYVLLMWHWKEVHLG